MVGQDEEEVAAEPPTEELEVDSQIETPAEVTEDEIDIEEVKIPASDLLSEELETLAADVDTGNDL